MYKFAAFIEKHKYGILATLGVHVALFFYFQIATYEEKVDYEKWNFEGKYDEKEDIEITPDQIETPAEQELYDMSKEVKNMVQNVDDTREKVERPENYTSSVTDPSQNAYEVEEAMNQEIAGQKEGSKPSESNMDITENESQPEPPTKTKSKTQNQASSSQGIKAETMVSFQLTKRTPLNNNDWYIRNPGYTCGNVDGVVVVDIKVGQNGKVISAKYDAKRSTNANACMISKAEEYASISRFNYSESAPRSQNGYIKYTFIYQ